MDTSQDIRHARLLIAIEIAGSIKALADLCDVSVGYLSQLKGRLAESSTGVPRGMGNAVARKIEKGLGKPHGWMDGTVTDLDDERLARMTRSKPFVVSRSTGIFELREDKHGVAYFNTNPGPDIKGRVPLISWVQAGNWSSVVDNFHPGHAEEWIETTVPIRQHTYALRVKGDSMTNPSGTPSFPHGIVIIVEPEVEALPGAYVVVRQNSDDECTFKQLVKDAGAFFLKPLNPAYPLMRLAEDAVICGVVREATMRFF